LVTLCDWICAICCMVNQGQPQYAASGIKREITIILNN
jgi:hypothetical protein